MNRAARALGYPAFGLACAAAALPFATQLPNFIISDDGFFYAQIAFNIAQLHRSTFDGIHTTSGYHLPWGFALAAASLIVGLFTKAKAAHLFAHLALSFTLIGWTTHTFFRSWWFRAAVFIIFTTRFSLTEMALAAPLLLALFRKQDSPRVAPLLGAAVALVRIDLACVPLFLALTDRDRARGVRLGLATLAGAALQLAMMRLAFGHFFSVAAELKAGGGLHHFGALLPLNVSSTTFQLLTYAAHGLLAGLAIRLQPKTARLVAAALVFLAAHTLLSIVRPWYWVPSWLLLLFVLEQSLDARSPSPGVRRGTMGLVAFVALAFGVHAARVELVYRDDQANAQRFLADLERTLPAGTAVYTWVTPGYLAFFSNLRVVDGDGLVNDYSYARRLRGGSLAGYLEEEGICWVMSDFLVQHPKLAVNGLVLDDPADMTPVLQRPRHLRPQTDFGLFRLTSPRCRDAAH